jgi:hypothetical protein
MGERAAKSIVYDDAIEAGNKLIANLNIMRIYGKRRTTGMTRLHRPALAGEKEILVEPSLDLVKGDRLALVPTSY